VKHMLNSAVNFLNDQKKLSQLIGFVGF
jgi:hypothetical protein